MPCRAPLARFASPTEQLLRRQPMAACNHRHRCSRLQRLLNDPRLVIHRPTTTSAGTSDHFDAPDLALRLKRRFKSRHKPIPISQQDQHHYRSRPSQKGGLRTPLTQRRRPPGLARRRACPHRRPPAPPSRRAAALALAQASHRSLRCSYVKGWRRSPRCAGAD
jgi:hypothetical protein